MIISEAIPYTDAFITAWYPGTEAQGIADVLFGDFNPSGKLTHTWPRNMEQIPINWGDTEYDPLFSYKHGLQDFPSFSNAENLGVYFAVTSADGSSIQLIMDEEVTDLTSTIADFSIEVNDQDRQDLLESVSVAASDDGIILLALTEPVKNGDEIRLAYTGGGIASSLLLLPAFQDLYVHNAIDPANTYHSIPGRLEAEHYFDMNGIQTETCTDVGGGIKVGWIDGGDWMKYYVTVSQTGVYRITGRIAGFNGGTLSMIFDGTTQTFIQYNATNGWQNWKDFSSQVELEAGNYILEVSAQSDGFNINYFDFDFVSSTDNPSMSAKVKNIRIFLMRHYGRTCG